jgi:HD-GYP domain-containing protein (c-di-GMP phosphodiesterase class II)
VRVSDEIPREPGRLSELEMDKMRKHPVRGSEILTGSDSELP